MSCMNFPTRAVWNAASLTKASSAGCIRRFCITTKKAYLITPGPTPVPPEVSAKEGMPILHHRTGEFGVLFSQVIEDLKHVFQTKNDVLLTAGSGTAALESAVANLLSPGDKALVIS